MTKTNPELGMNNIMTVVYDKAVEQYRQKKYAAAAALFSQLAQRGVDSSVVSYFGGVSFFRIKKYDQALPLLKLTVDKKKNYYHTAYARIFIALIHIDNKKYGLAKTSLTKAIDSGFANPLPHSLLGYIASKKKNYAEAEVQYKKALALDKENPSFHNNLGYNYVEWNRDLDKAEFHLKKALRLKKNNPYYLHSFGWLQFLLKQFDRAKSFLVRSFQLKKSKVVEKDLLRVEEEIAKR